MTLTNLWREVSCFFVGFSVRLRGFNGGMVQPRVCGEAPLERNVWSMPDES